MLNLNQIYKVKKGHEGKCESFKEDKGKYIKITKIDANYNYDILDENNEVICKNHWGCFTEDDLEEEVKIEKADRIDYCCQCDKEHGYDCPLDKPKSLEDLEVGDEVIDDEGIEYSIENVSKAYYLYRAKESFWRSVEELKNQDYIVKNVKSLSPSEAETLLEEKLGYKVKIK